MKEKILALSPFQSLDKRLEDDEEWRSFRSQLIAELEKSEHKTNRSLAARVEDDVENSASTLTLADVHPDLQRTIDQGIAPSTKRLLNDRYQMVWRFDRVL